MAMRRSPPGALTFGLMRAILFTTPTTGDTMDLRGRLSRTTFEATLTPAHIMTSQILQGALMMGAVMFLFGVLFMYSRGPLVAPGEAEFDTVRTLTFVHLAFLVVNVGVSIFLAQKLFSPEAMAEVLTGMDDPLAIAQRCAQQQRTAMIVRMALLEGSTFFGLAICMIGSTNGVLAAASEYWINLLSLFLLVGFGIATFPTKERLAEWFEERFLRV
jgi:hypothetical protein